MSKLIPLEVIEKKIYLIRGKKVMVDFDLAKLYRVPTGRLNEQVKRNIERFPDDFMFQLTKAEHGELIAHLTGVNLKSQNAISRWGGRRKLPFVFTEQGVAMLSSVLKSKKAIQVNIAIMRAFIKLREILSTHQELANKLGRLEQKTQNHDVQIHSVFQAIRKLMAPPKKRKNKIGFLK